MLHIGGKEKEYSLIYTIFSREIRFSNFETYNGIVNMIFTKYIPWHVKMKSRLIEESQMKILLKKLKENTRT